MVLSANANQCSTLASWQQYLCMIHSVCFMLSFSEGMSSFGRDIGMWIQRLYFERLSLIQLAPSPTSGSLLQSIKSLLYLHNETGKLSLVLPAWPHG